MSKAAFRISLVACAIACHDSMSPRQYVGTYTLVAAEGKPLPALVGDGGDKEMSGSITLHADDTAERFVADSIFCV